MSLTAGKGAISVAFVRPSIAYIPNNSRTQRPSVPKFGRKVRCDSHTNFEVKRSKVRVRGGRGYTVSAEPGIYTACLERTAVSSISLFKLGVRVDWT